MSDDEIMSDDNGVLILPILYSITNSYEPSRQQSPLSNALKKLFCCGTVLSKGKKEKEKCYQTSDSHFLCFRGVYRILNSVLVN